MSTEPFNQYVDVFEYAKRHGLDLVCEGTVAFQNRSETLPPGAFIVRLYRSGRRVKRVGLFSKRFRHTEWMIRRGIIEVNDSGGVRVLNGEMFAQVGENHD